MVNQLNSWTPVAIIVIGYVIGFYFQNNKLADFKDGLYRYIDAKFETVNIRLKAIEDRLDKIEKRLDKMEDYKLVR
jgi:chaperonin cofactor prefoldin